MVVAKVLEKVVEVLGFDMNIWRLVDLEMLGLLYRRVLEYQGPPRGLAWVLLVSVVAPSLVFRSGVIVPGFCCLVALANILDLGYEVFLPC